MEISENQWNELVESIKRIEEKLLGPRPATDQSRTSGTTIMEWYKEDWPIGPRA